VGQREGEKVDQAPFPVVPECPYALAVDAPLSLLWQELRAMLRVLHVLDHSLPLHSGYAFRTRAIMSAQAADGLEVRGITGLRHSAEGPPAEVADGLLFHRTRRTASGPAPLKEWREIGALADAIGKLVEDWRPDVLHAPFAGAVRHGRAARRAAPRPAAGLRDPRVLGGCRGRQRHRREGSLKYRLTRGLENRVVGGADAVMTICHGCATT
jgi:hypothetical protein